MPNLSRVPLRPATLLAICPPMWRFAIGLNVAAVLAGRCATLSCSNLQACLVLPAFCLGLSFCLRRWAPRRPDLSYLFEVFAFISLVKLPFVVLSYAGATLAMPLWDADLLHADEALGFHWPALMHWVDGRPFVATLLFVAYKTIWLQLVAFVILGTLSATRRDIDTLLLAVAVALGGAIALGAVCPALGILSVYPGEHFDVLHFTGGTSPIPVVEGLRTGSIHVVDLWHPEGVVVFPSFHAAMAVILMSAAQRHWLMAAVSTPLNLLMLASAYTEGGHYVCDLIVGAAIGAFAWRIAVLRLSGMMAQLPQAPKPSRPHILRHERPQQSVRDGGPSGTKVRSLRRDHHP